MPKSFAVALGDVDADSDLDAFVANGHAAYLGEPNTVWLNDGSGHFADSGQRLGYPVFNSDDSRAIDLGDVDGDGDLDAFIGNNGANEIWLNDGGAQGGTQGNFTYSGQALGDASTQVVFLEDLDGDGDCDAFAGNGTAAEIWLNDGTGRFVDGGQDISYSDRDAVTVGDIDGDGNLDILTMNFDRGYRVWLNDGAGHFRLSGRQRAMLPWLAGGSIVVLGLFGWWAIRRRRIADRGR